MSAVDVIVVGLGAMGCAALHHLARRGVEVVGLEKHAIGHAMGSSHGGTRVIRKAYAEEPRYVPLVLRAYELWNELELETGASLLRVTGGLHIGRPEHPSLRSIESAVGKHGLACERLGREEIGDRFPAFVLGDDEVGLYEPDAGVLAVEDALAAHVAAATRSGARVELGCDVVSIEARPESVRVSTAGGECYEAARAIVSLGAYASVATPIDLGLPLHVSRQVQCWFRPTSPTAFTGPAFPLFIHHTELGDYYGLEALDRGGIKVCRHHGGAQASIEAIDRAVHEDDIDEVRRYLQRHLPGANGESLGASVCIYTNTPDQHFVLGHGAPASLVVAAGFSGHGFKFAPVVGEILADLATAGRTEHDISMFAPGRFGGR